MPRVAIEGNERMSLRIARLSAKLVRAAALSNTDLTNS